VHSFPPSPSLPSVTGLTSISLGKAIYLYFF
jgi:hypothetical protein